jgi:hypothetical protein
MPSLHTSPSPAETSNFERGASAFHYEEPELVEECDAPDTSFAFLVAVMDATDLKYVSKLLKSGHPNALPFEKGNDPRKDIRWLVTSFSPLSGPRWPWRVGRVCSAKVFPITSTHLR